MGRLIRIEDVEQFAEIGRVPQKAVSPEILSAVRHLHEKDHVEPFLQEILFDPNETPHGPTEIADVITTRIRIGGAPRVAAIVMKGRSWPKVSSKDVAHQFFKLRQLPAVDLAIFLAVGHIQDDAQRDFLQTALDASWDYLIIDAQDVARLFLAYQKICPQDGLPYEAGHCANGHALDPGVRVQMEVHEKLHYTVLQQEDVSHAGAKRYSLTVLVDPHYTQATYREIIRDVIARFRTSTYQRNEAFEAHWAGTAAHVMWVYLAADLRDVQQATWICRACWIDPALPSEVRPNDLGGQEREGDLEIDWNSSYTFHREFLGDFHTEDKGAYLRESRRVGHALLELADAFVERYQTLLSNKEPVGATDAFYRWVSSEWEAVDDLYRDSGNLSFPPEDCKRYDDAFHASMGDAHQLFFLNNHAGVAQWPELSRIALTRQAMRRYEENRAKLLAEEQALR